MQFKNQQKLTAVASKSQATTTSGIAKKFVKIMASFCSGRRSGSLGFRGLRIGTPNGGMWNSGAVSRQRRHKDPPGHTHTHLSTLTLQLATLWFILYPYAFLHIICFCNSKRLSVSSLETRNSRIWRLRGH